ncbi:methyltransferase [Massilia sp. KIM]|uniref:class I SAM-dependent methyltransferase n=1 Tax=Massilia sp. KIM TaxID=1955422 RepID=UPI00098FC89B|nr:class I SAM-dependent methyltransferase [Massilia sp. KIM]OON62597.1 methyltransferase [Massilia sp. KIM]
MENNPYNNPGAIASYAGDTPRKVPGLADLHRMAMLLLAEAAPATANILVVGAGGGLETRALAEARPGWRFTGVDPAPAMLALARQTLAPCLERVELIEGTVGQAPAGPYEGATCLLTLHHLGREERLDTLRGIRRRLRPGARLVVAGHTAAGPDPQQWMARSIAFGERGEPDWERAWAGAANMLGRLPLLAPDEEHTLLGEAGFADIGLFYAAFSFRGWVARA